MSPDESELERRFRAFMDADWDSDPLGLNEEHSIDAAGGTGTEGVVAPAAATPSDEVFCPPERVVMS